MQLAVRHRFTSFGRNHPVVASLGGVLVGVNLMGTLVTSGMWGNIVIPDSQDIPSCSSQMPLQNPNGRTFFKSGTTELDDALKASQEQLDVVRGDGLPVGAISVLTLGTAFLPTLLLDKSSQEPSEPGDVACKISDGTVSVRTIFS